MPQFDNEIKDPQGLGKKNWILLNRNVQCDLNFHENPHNFPLICIHYAQF